MTLSPKRARFALLALALGGFSIGSTEYVAMGLLPDIARDLLPELSASNPEASIGRAGWLITAYAVGVVVGAPTIAAAAARFPRKAVLVGLGIAFTVGMVGMVGTVASALAPTFALVVAARFVAGLPHGAYFGVAALVAAQILGPKKRGQAVAYVLVGLTIASVVGVPLITYLGQHAGWRVAYLVVAGLFALTTAALLAFIPAHAGNPSATIRRELKAFTRPAVWAALLTASLGFGGFFAVYSYVSPLATEVTGTSAAFVPIVLMVLGLGTTVGILGNGLGALLGGMAIAAGFGYLSPTWLGLILVVPGVLFALVGWSVTRRTETRLAEVA